MKDLIIGCYTDYDWEKIKYWVNSLDQSGFTGDKTMIVYNSDYATVNELIKRNFNIFAFNRNDTVRQFSYPNKFSIVVQRFYDIWKYLSNLPEDRKYRYVITTDVKDVIFQSDPSVWLKTNLKNKKLLVSAECLRYQDEPWGLNNMRLSFPMMLEFMQSKAIYNCGVLAGDVATIRDLSLNIYLSCLGLPGQIPGGGGPDQAALNILLQTDVWKDVTKFAASEDGWACQSGTTVDPNLMPFVASKLLEPQPIWDGEYACTSKGRRYPIVHQWERIPTWKSIIEGKFK